MLVSNFYTPNWTRQRLLHRISAHLDLKIGIFILLNKVFGAEIRDGSLQYLDREERKVSRNLPHQKTQGAK
jgi:hypothetical protein